MLEALSCVSGLLLVNVSVNLSKTPKWTSQSFYGTLHFRVSPHRGSPVYNWQSCSHVSLRHRLRLSRLSETTVLSPQLSLSAAILCLKICFYNFQKATISTFQKKTFTALLLLTFTVCSDLSLKFFFSILWSNGQSQFYLTILRLYYTLSHSLSPRACSPSEIIFFVIFSLFTDSARHLFRQSLWYCPILTASIKCISGDRFFQFFSSPGYRMLAFPSITLLAPHPHGISRVYLWQQFCQSFNYHLYQFSIISCILYGQINLLVWFASITDSLFLRTRWFHHAISPYRSHQSASIIFTFPSRRVSFFSSQNHSLSPVLLFIFSFIIV